MPSVLEPRVGGEPGRRQASDRGRGAYVNNRWVSDPAAEAKADYLLHAGWLVLRRGKRNLAVAELADG